ncbi:MAG: YggU family protein [Lentisphaerae bacterium GWF2_52_8]|nr:MAG: YggU family protein [Lentisphaerae bacterium GWF2_52_8]
MDNDELKDIVKEAVGGVRLSCRVQPKASRNAIAGIHGGALKIALCAPPVDGKANEALCRFLAELFDLPKSAISIATGEKGRSKSVAISGANTEKIMNALLRIP